MGLELLRLHFGWPVLAIGQLKLSIGQNRRHSSGAVLRVLEVDVVSDSTLDILDDLSDILRGEISDVESVAVPQTADGLGLAPQILLVAVLPKFLLLVATIPELSDVHPNVQVLRGHPAALYVLGLSVKWEVLAAELGLGRASLGRGLLSGLGCLAGG